MIRLRSPHTVIVYGAVTSLPGRMVLVMELLFGGDLQTLLRNSWQPLPQEQSRRIIGDICAGMPSFTARTEFTTISSRPACYWTGLDGRR